MIVTDVKGIDEQLLVFCVWLFYWRYTLKC